MHSFQAGCEWFSRSQDGDIPLLLTGREWHLSGIGRIVRSHCLFEQALIVLAFDTGGIFPINLHSAL
ncbi:hypothetical protein SAMN05421736_103194 [Evansella caseinilytica]|uniref:Uncharacterized protein n=1 Tax=Evansella caseinilytica TaxID=1503961 RepID=A0A1H3MD53_9BACI|nr:hypothetical protein [Evansella caseinilytica]SDY74652.1 hypothetical protein SAMN05421736_103194 [Evansella caseinilytica]